MDRDTIPDDVKRFILVSIPSVPHLEALLLLRSKMAESWDSKTVAQRLYISEKAAADLLMDLNAAGLLAHIDSDVPLYRYAPTDEHLITVIDRLADTYAMNLISVSKLIHSTIGRKAHQFSDAFKLRKDS